MFRKNINVDKNMERKNRYRYLNKIGIISTNRNRNDEKI